MTASHPRRSGTAVEPLPHLWNLLDRVDAQNPVRWALKPALADAEARELACMHIEKILAAMPNVGHKGGVTARTRS
jgi:hypothetical protein